MVIAITVALSPAAYPLGRMLVSKWPRLLHKTSEHKDRRCPFESEYVIESGDEQSKYHMLLPGRSTNTSMPHFVCTSLVGAYFITFGGIGLFWD